MDRSVQNQDKSWAIARTTFRGATFVPGKGMSEEAISDWKNIADLNETLEKLVPKQSHRSTLPDGEMSVNGVDKFTHRAYFVVQIYYGRTETIQFSRQFCKRAGEFLKSLVQGPVIMVD